MIFRVPWKFGRGSSEYASDNGGKIFGIGLSGTATRALIKALKEFCFNARHYPQKLEHFNQYALPQDVNEEAREYATPLRMLRPTSNHTASARN